MGKNNKPRKRAVRINGRQLLVWHFLIDMLTSPNFEEFIRWTGLGYQFEIHNPVVTFTELRKRKDEEAEPTTGDPAIRWHGQMIAKDKAKNAEKSLYRSYEKRNGNVDKRRKDMPFIAKTPNVIHGHHFVGHEEICEYKGWTLEQLNEYIRQVVAGNQRNQNRAPSVQEPGIPQLSINPVTIRENIPVNFASPEPFHSIQSSQPSGSGIDPNFYRTRACRPFSNTLPSDCEPCPFSTPQFTDTLTSFTSSHATILPSSTQMPELDSFSNYRDVKPMTSSIDSSTPWNSFPSTTYFSATASPMDEETEIAQIEAHLLQSSEHRGDPLLEIVTEMPESPNAPSHADAITLALQMEEDLGRQHQDSENS